MEWCKVAPLELFLVGRFCFVWFLGDWCGLRIEKTYGYSWFWDWNFAVVQLAIANDHLIFDYTLATTPCIHSSHCVVALVIWWNVFRSRIDWWFNMIYVHSLYVVFACALCIATWLLMNVCCFFLCSTWLCFTLISYALNAATTNNNNNNNNNNNLRNIFYLNYLWLAACNAIRRAKYNLYNRF